MMGYTIVEVRNIVLMHLLVLGAFRRKSFVLRKVFREVLMHLLVLGAFRLESILMAAQAAKS